MGNSFFDVVESEFNTDEIARVVCEKLKNKYSEEFIVKRIGNRYGMNSFENVTLYCAPKKEEALIFTIVYDMVNEKIIEDDYYIRQVSYELEFFIKLVFSKCNYQVLNRIEILKKSNLEKEYNLEEFTTTFKNSIFLATIVICENNYNKSFKKIFEVIKEKFPDLKLKALVYIIDKSDFIEYEKKVNTLPTLSLTDIEKYKIQDFFRIRIIDNNLTIEK